MKIALCLSGHFRNFEATFPSLDRKLLSKYDIDIFISTWDKLGFSCLYKTDAILNDTSGKIELIQNLFKPKKIIVEPSYFIEELKKQGDIYAPHLKFEPKHVGHMASMFYKIYAANELRNLFQRETGIKYDAVIRSRSDLMFNIDINIPDLDEKSIYLPGNSSHPGWYTDQLAIGLPEDMDIYSSFFFDIQEYFLARKEFYPEKFMCYCFEKKNLNFKTFSCDYYIYR